MFEQLKPEDFSRAIKDANSASTGATLCVLASLILLGVTTCVPKAYRPGLMCGVGLTALAASEFGSVYLRNERESWSKEIISHEASQDRTYQQIVTRGEESDDTGWKPVLYDWKDLVVKHGNSKFKHRTILGTTGDGKTTLVQWLLTLMGEESIVFAPKWQQGDFPNSRVVGSGGNWKEMADELKAIDREYQERLKLYETHQYRDVQHIVFDDYMEIVAQLTLLKLINKNPVNTWLTMMRGLYQVLWLGTQVDTVVASGMQGIGDVRKNTIYIRLGSYAIEYAKWLYNSGEVPIEFYSYVRAMPRPCMVDDLPAVIPEIRSVPEVTKQVDVEVPTEPKLSVTLEEVQDVADNTGLTPSGVIKTLAKRYGVDYQTMKEAVEGLPVNYAKKPKQRPTT